MACSHGHTQHMHANTGTNTHTDTHTNARMHARIHTHTDTCMHTCTHTYTSHSRTIPPCKTSQCMSCRQDHMVTLLPTTLHLHVLYVYTSNPVHLGKLQTSTWMFRAVGPHQGSGASKTPTRPLNSITFTDTHSHWTIQTHITGLPSNPIPYTCTCSRIIRHIAPLPRRYTQSHMHTLALTQSIIQPQCFKHPHNMMLHRCTCTLTCAQDTHVAGSHRHTQHLHTCTYIHTHKRARTHTHTHKHTSTHTDACASTHTRTHTHTCTHTHTHTHVRSANITEEAREEGGKDRERYCLCVCACVYLCVGVCLSAP